MKLVEDNLALVHACCRRFKNRGIEYEELFSAGCLGLVKAARNYNPELGHKLSTYAVPVILGELKRLFRDGGTVKVSRSLKELGRRLTTLSESFCSEHGRSPTVSELSALTGEPEDKISDALNSVRIPLSLTFGDEDGGGELELPTEDIAESLTEEIALRELIERLPSDDRRLIELRYYKYLTQTETARRMNMTQVQVSRREKKILAELRMKLG